MKIGNLLDEPTKSAANVSRNAGIWILRETLDVHFVNHGLGGRTARGCIIFPVIGSWIDNDALHRRGGVLASFLSRQARVILGSHYSATIRVEQTFGGIKA